MLISRKWISKSLAIFTIISTLLLTPVSTLAVDPAKCDPTTETGCPAGLDQLTTLIDKIIQLIVPFGFLALVAMLTWAGIRFLTSAGEQEGLKKARSTATWAMVGILFMIIAWLLLKLVQSFTGVNVTQFCLNFSGTCS